MKKKTLYGLMIVLMCTLLNPYVTLAKEFFEYNLPWDDASQNITNLSFLNHTPAGKYGFVTVKNGHLYAEDKRIKLLGVNVVFHGTVPDYDTADKVAARLARFGINAVRFHHLEGAPAPKGILNADMQTFNTQYLDRFDYFFAALKKNGIYSDINLQVTRKYPNFLPPHSKGRKWAKGIDLFEPTLIKHQKEYAKKLLLHRNPYTGTRYADEPAVVFIEINNENGLLQAWQAGHLDHIHHAYKQTLRLQWESWLAKRYSSSYERLKAWSGIWINDEIILPQTVKQETDGWQLQLANGAKGVIYSTTAKSFKVDISHKGIQDWDAQVHWPNIRLSANKRYKLGIKLKSNTPSKVTIHVGQNHFPWKNLWRESIELSSEWKTIESEFSIPSDENQARLTITGLGLSIQKLEVADVKLSGFVLDGQKQPTFLGSDTAIKVPTTQNFKSLDMNIQKDWMQFLWYTESAYWADMQTYLRDSLGVKSLLIGTQANWLSPAAIQASLDVIDVHGYWDHPIYPRKPYDMNDWIMQDDFLAGNANAGTVTDLAMFRVFGKPFVVTEYDHPFPNSYQAEGLPLIAAYGSFQDWDAVFQYCYGLHTGSWQDTKVSHFFDSHANPVKMIGMISSALLFRREDVKASLVTKQQSILPFDKDIPTWIAAMLSYNRVPSAREFGVARDQALYQAVGFNAGLNDAHTKAGLVTRTLDAIVAKLNIKTQAITNDTGELTWNHPNSVVTINTPRSKGIIGAPWNSVTLEKWKFELLNAPLQRGVLLSHVMEGENFENATRVLVISMSEVKNQGTSYYDPWNGDGAAQIALTPAKLEIPIPSKKLQAWALDTRGNRMMPLSIEKKGAESTIIMLDKKTVWYEIQID